jgi:hypothetical protein
LPDGVYELTLDDLKNSRLVRGPDQPRHNSGWDRAWRARLVVNLEILVRQLWTIGIDQIFANGSFIEDKDHPNDIDGYFECDRTRLLSGELQRELNLLDPYKVWTWDHCDRRPYRGYPKLQLPMWHRYRVELYPHVGQPSGIRDAHGSSLSFAVAFRRARYDSH